MTSCAYENNQKTQGQSVGYVKVRFFAHPLNVSRFLDKICGMHVETDAIVTKNEFCMFSHV